MNQIKKVRRKRKMERKQLAYLMNMSVSALGRRERGEVPLLVDEVRRFAEVLECNIEEILGGKWNEK